MKSQAVLDSREQHRRHRLYWGRQHRRAHVRKLGVGYVSRICVACGKRYKTPEKWAAQSYCFNCAADAHYARNDATSEVTKAIRLGVLMRADQFRCVDCDNWAAVWDHRDYHKPFQVEPVCKSCNSRRPAAYRREARAAS